MGKRPKILVVGSFVMDQIASTQIFPREGQTVLGESFRKAPGGKGANQAVQAARLGADVTMFGKLGNDTNGEELLAACNQAGVNTRFVTYDDTEASGCAMIILEEAPGQETRNRIIVIPGTNMSITPSDVAFLKGSIAEYDMVILQLEIPMEINEIVAKYAFDQGVPTMLNSAPSAPLSDELLACLSFISPNEHEAEDMTGIHIRHVGSEICMEDVRAAAEILLKKGIQNVLITLGSGGAALFNRAGSHYAPCSTDVTVVDPTAAGDSFVGAFCTGVCCGWSWDEILLFANSTASITVSSMGAMPSLPELSAVKQIMAQRQEAIPNTAILE